MMPIYIVRWPDLSASLVRAASEEELPLILDQVANPEGCEWSVYEGPLFINFRLPVQWNVRDERPGRPVAPEQLVIESVGAMASVPVAHAMELEIAEGDDGLDMAAEILREAFPAIHAATERYVHGAEEGPGDGVLPEAQLRKAVHAELSRFLGVSWRQAQLEGRTDKVSQLARIMDMPESLVRRHVERAGEDRVIGEEPEPDDEE